MFPAEGTGKDCEERSRWVTLAGRGLIGRPAGYSRGNKRISGQCNPEDREEGASGGVARLLSKGVRKCLIQDVALGLNSESESVSLFLSVPVRVVVCHLADRLCIPGGILRLRD